MKRKFLYSFFALFAVNALFIGCKKELAIKPNELVLSEDVFTDRSLINSVLARFYGANPFAASNNGGEQNNNGWNSFQQDPDDGINNNGGISTANLGWGRDRYRTFDYVRIRELNQFLQGIRTEASRKSMTPEETLNYEAQGMFLRAYVFYKMVRTLGGLSIVGDQVFDYQPGTDVVPWKVPRNSEAECWQYIIDQSQEAADKFGEASKPSNNFLGTAKTTNAANANKWTALMLKARAALAAASIAKYTPLRASNNVKTDPNTGKLVAGIDPGLAAGFYTTALAAAEEVITQSPYVLQVNTSSDEASRLEFYRATTIKSNNTEVIWATDRKSPSGNGNIAITFTRDVSPRSKGHNDGQNEGNSLGPTLNLVEAFENKDGSNPKIQDFDANGDHIVYADVEAPFKAKDARLWGTVIWPYANFRGTPVPLRTGELRSFDKTNGNYTYTTSVPNTSREDLPTDPTGPNGPWENSASFYNKTGFNIRKWVDETPGSGIAPNYSEIWWPRFRISEAYMISAEAAFELNQTGKALERINYIRVNRGRIQPLAAITFEDIVNENRVEFAFEDHRVWDLIRWRYAHIVWTGTADVPDSQPMMLNIYRINIPGDPRNGQWVFRRKVAYRRPAPPAIFNFPVDAYYSTISSDWVNPNNPNWVGNPFQAF